VPRKLHGSYLIVAALFVDQKYNVTYILNTILYVTLLGTIFDNKLKNRQNKSDE